MLHSFSQRVLTQESSSLRRLFVVGVVSVGMMVIAGLGISATSSDAVAVLGVPPVYAAINIDDTGLSDTGDAASLTTDTQLPQLVGNVIKAALGLLGVIFLILMVYAGFRWFLARGEAGEVKKAIDIIRDATVGLLIVLGSYALTGFVVDQLIKAAGTQ